MIEFILATATIVGQVQIDANTYQTNFLTQEDEIITILQKVSPESATFKGC